MSRLLLAVAATLVALAVPAAPTAAHEGDPDYESRIRAVAPAVDGLRVEVVNRDDSLQLTNGTGRDVHVPGYGGEPYARLLTDGTVQVNRRSEATWTNRERDGKVQIPGFVDADAPPQWQTLDRTGRFAWHDHRIHWMGEGLPPQIRQEGEGQRLYDWRVPVRVGAREITIRGTLFYTPRGGGGPPAAALATLAAIVGGAVLLVVVVRRRRARADGAGEAREAW